MKFSPQQDRALRDVARWLHARNSQVYRLFGYAGTGKTTLAKYIAAHADGRVLFAAFTGKAAHVMRRKGCESASTLHHLIYRCINTEDGPLFKLNRDSPLAGAALLIVDECSMVDAQLGADILSFGVPVLVLGDPAQLPPIGGNAGFFTEATPDILLTDIHRQARDNPIIRMATTVREGGYLAVGDYGSSRVVDFDYDMVAKLPSFDQILVGYNLTRRIFNRQLRDQLGFKGIVPQPRDRLVCLRNKHDRGLLNGSIWTTRNVQVKGDGIIELMITSDEAPETVVPVKTHQAFFQGTEKNLPNWRLHTLDWFDFGYALTVHKAQGSQWDNVMVRNEPGVAREDAHRWLYTAITRAAERLTLAFVS
jgi:exodeoxyribonuclease-5